MEVLAIWVRPLEGATKTQPDLQAPSVGLAPDGSRGALDQQDSQKGLQAAGRGCQVVFVRTQMLMRLVMMGGSSFLGSR